MSKHINLSGLKTLLEPLVHLINKKAERPDWNENDPSSPDYIENRPFYEETGFVEYTVNVTNEIVSYDVPLPSFVDGETYNITWDGVEYSCVAYVALDAGVPVIGNDILGEAGTTGGNGEPFCIVVFGGQNLIFVETTGTHTLGINGSVIHKIDEKYLPPISSVGKEGTANGAEIFNCYGDNGVNANIANAVYSHAEGIGVTASGNGAHAEGCNTTASGHYSHAEGDGTTASGFDSHAEGATTRAIGNYSHAEGEDTAAYGEASHAEGEGSIAEGIGSHAEGCGCANGKYSHAEGNTTAHGDYSHSEGVNSYTYGKNSHAEGYFSKAYGDNSHSEGHYNMAIGTNSHGEGYTRMSDYCYLTGDANSLVYTIFADSNTKDFINKIIFVDNDNAYAQILTQELLPGTVQIGYSSKYQHKVTVNKTLSTVKSYDKEYIPILWGGAFGSDSHIEGSNTQALGYDSHAEGEYTIAVGTDSHAEGNNTHSVGGCSHSEGHTTEAIGDCSHAEGFQTIALGDNSSAHGKYTIAIGDNNFTIGKYNKNEEGGYIKTSLSQKVQYQYKYAGDPKASLTEPIFNEVTKTYVLQNPFTIRALSDISVGAYLSAKGGRGYYKVLSIGNTSSYFVHLTVDITEYLDPNGTDAFVIGNGTSDASRSNAHTLDWSGNAWYAGDVYVGSTSGTNKDEGSKKLATESNVSSQIAEHDTSVTAHNDIRDFITAPKNSIAFIDQVNGYTYIACMREGNLVTYCATKSIEVTSMPNKTEYTAGEYFDPTGMVITATAHDGTTKEITDFICPSTYITEGSTYIEIKYVEVGIVHTATVPVTVNVFDAATTLVDFDYTTNDDGTYTVTGWKGTLNGVESTEIIIPNNGLIVV